jgi:D-alanyl-lipoteichoic acid acyltransferase DltB (MBOAT superfamily)
MQNFAFPYFSRDIAEFWRRWHISLSTWFRDYVYIPLGGSRGSIRMRVRNIFIIFIVSGFWHGANWTFIVWGALNALYFLPLMLFNKNRINTDTVAHGKYLPSVKEFISMSLTFGLTVLAWVFFRAVDVPHALSFLSEIFSSSFFTIPEERPKYLVLIILFFVIIEWFGREHKYAIEKLWLNSPKLVRWGIYYVLAMTVILLAGEKSQFIYFQF